jgi:beta,beta-carotene 9',10'-dioxygenase
LPRGDSQTLKTLVGAIYYDDQISGHHESAHPHYDAAAHMTVSHLTEFVAQSQVRVFSLADEDDQHRRMIGAYARAEPSSMYSFSIIPILPA